MWLRDYLPDAVPDARILTYGYDTKLQGSKSSASILDLAMSFLEVVKTARGGEKVTLLRFRVLFLEPCMQRV